MVDVNLVVAAARWNAVYLNLCKHALLEHCKPEHSWYTREADGPYQRCCHLLLMLQKGYMHTAIKACRAHAKYFNMHVW